MSSPPNTHSICIFGHRPKQFVLFKHIHKAHSLLHTKFGGGGSKHNVCPLAQPATQPQYVYIPAQTEQFVFFKQIHKIQYIIQTKFGGGGEQHSPRVSPREALRNPLGGPSEHHRDPMGILLESLYPMGHQKSPIGNPISTPWVFPWKAHRNPSVSSHTDPLGTHWYPRNPMGIPKVFHGSIAPFEYPTGIL